MDLVIGSSSQLAQYFPDDYIKISSRNIDFNYLKNNNWESVYITFAEQRIYERDIDYVTPNYLQTLKIIEALLSNSKKIVCYTSCELWSDLEGMISIDTKPKFNLQKEYTLSKLLLWNKIRERRKLDPIYDKVVFIHPFYFNSVHRSRYFLFGKVFHSIINKKKIQVGNIDFPRDMVHAQFVVDKSIEQTRDCLVGSGKLFNVKTLIQDLYELNNMDFFEYVEELGDNLPTNKCIVADVKWDYTYKNLLKDTQRDIEQFKTRTQ